MNVPLIVAVAIFIIGIILIFKVVKKIFSLIFSIVGLAILIFIVIALLIAADKSALEKGFLEMPTLFVLESASDIVAGYSTNPSTILDSTTIEQINENGLDSVRGEYFKVFTIPIESATSMIKDSGVKVNGETFSKDEAVALISHENELERKTELFRALVMDIIGDDPVEGITTAVKEGKATVLKKSIAFRRFLP